MKRFVKTAVMATASCAMVLGSAGISAAHCDGSHARKARNGHQESYVVQARMGHQARMANHYGRSGGHHGRRGATAIGYAKGSPGVLSGNVVQVPIDIPINVCGNSVGVFQLLSPAFRNICVNK
ncbi:MULTISPECIES: chaplin [unclassified Streptomyces]|uniref:chaplin n=1 Tax=unclassified Streptomyces TaxID=2593676 RepID=UPI0038213642